MIIFIIIILLLDKDELLNELEELEQEELDAKMLDTPAPAMDVPDVPSHEPSKLLARIFF